MNNLRSGLPQTNLAKNCGPSSRWSCLRRETGSRLLWGKAASRFRASPAPAATPLPWEINARRMRHWHWGPMRCRDSLRLPQGRVAAALCSFAIRCECPAMLALWPWAILGLLETTSKCWRWSPMRCWDSLRLARCAGAGALSDDETLCESQSTGIEARQQQQQQEHSVTPGHALRWKCKEAVRVTLD